jgi:hypothetical protein
MYSEFVHRGSVAFFVACAAGSCVLAIGPRAAQAQAAQHPGVAGVLPVASKASLNDQTARANMLADPDWFHWGGTPVLSPDDGLYHIFYDRWSRYNGRLMRGWLYESQSAHATSANPEGPYQFQDTAQQSAGDNPVGRWDAFTVHNSYMVRLPDPDAGGRIRYFLYFIANRDTNSTFNDWYDHIVSQCIGVAVADSPGGPWTRSVPPVCVPAAPILGYVVNPAVTRMPSGKYLMLLKGRAANQPAGANSDAMGNYRIGTALADKPTGPFVIQPTVLFDAAGAVFEDPCVFQWNGRMYAAVKDSSGLVSGTPGISWISGTIGADGTTVTWTIPNHDPNALISARQLKWSDGTTTTLNNLERPFILQDATGKPTHLFCAAAVADPFYLSPYPPTPLSPVPPIPGANLPFNVCIPLAPVPPNNTCGNAISISVGGSYTGSTLNALPAGGTSACNNIAGTNPGVWYKFTETSPVPRRLKASLCDPVTDFDAMMVCYTLTNSGSPCGSANFTCTMGNGDSGLGCPLAQNSAAYSAAGQARTNTPVIMNWPVSGPAPNVSQCTVPNTTYYIAVLNQVAATGGHFVLHLDDTGEQCQGSPPPNNTCGNARQINTFPFWDVEYIADSVPSTPQVSCSDPANTSARGAVWYRFTPSQPGNFFHAVMPVQTTSAGNDTVITVYSAAPDCSSLTAVACNNTTESYDEWFHTTPPARTPVCSMTAGTTYYIEVSQFSATAALPNNEYLGFDFAATGPAPCYANCDGSTTAPVLNVGDFTCFLQKYAAGDPYANCDQSTTPPVLNVGDFTCFLQKFAAGCS